MDHTRLRQWIMEYLNSHNVINLATWGGDHPWAASLFYANQDLVLYFVSETKSLHAQQMEKNSQVAATITEDYHDWRQVKGIQLLGRVTPVPLLHLPRALKVYTGKFTFLDQVGVSSNLVFQVGGKALRARMYQLTVERIYYINNELGVGSRQELIL